MMKFALVFAAMYGIVVCEVPVNGIRPSNVLGGAEQHASFSFIRPGLTQTSYAFNGPSSHQSFSSSVGNPHLAQRVLPNVAHALAYRNPGLGYFPTGPISTAYANSPYTNSLYAHHPGFQVNSAPPPEPTSAFSYQQQAPLDQATALAYLQQYKQYHQATNAHSHVLQTPEAAAYQAQLGQYFALRAQQPAELQVQQHAQHQQAHGHTSHRQLIPVHETSEQGPEQLQLQQQVQQTPSQNLLGVAYSSAPSVAHVKVTGNGYKFDF